MNKYKPLVSILIPLYNAEDYIADTLRFVLQQTYSNIEIIIVDDSSSDTSYNIVTTYLSENVKLFRNPGKGACAARNYAFKQSKGDYIQFLDADDYCSNDKIEKQMDCLLGQPADTLVFCTLRLLRRDILSTNQLRLIDQDYESPVELLIDMWKYSFHNGTHCYMAHRSLFEACGGWDESILKNQDGDFFSRVIEKSNKVYFIPEVYAVWRLTNRGISYTNTTDTMRSQLKVIELISKIILNYQNSKENRSICASQIGWFLYLSYPENKSLIPEAQKLLKQWGEPVSIPAKGRLFLLLRPFLGWKFSARFVKNSLVIAICSMLDTKK